MDDVLTHARGILSTTPARWLSLTAAVPPGLIARPPAPGEWSALQCLQHLVDTETRVFPVRVQAVLAGRDFAAFDPDAQGTTPAADETPAALAASFAERRAASLAALAAVRAADLLRTARHAELGLVTLSELLHEWAGHDLMHTVQAERAVMQPFIAGCGPWRPYFADHDSEAKTRG